MHAAAKTEMRVALGGDNEPRCEFARVGSGQFGELMNSGARRDREFPIGEYLHRLTVTQVLDRRNRSLPDRGPGEVRRSAKPSVDPDAPRTAHRQAKLVARRVDAANPARTAMSLSSGSDLDGVLVERPDPAYLPSSPDSWLLIALAGLPGARPRDKARAAFRSPARAWPIRAGNQRSRRGP